MSSPTSLSKPPPLSTLLLTTAASALVVVHLKPLVESLVAYGSRCYHDWVVVKRTASPPSQHGTGTGTISHLYTHPIKSLRSVEQDYVVLDDKGVAGDRRYMLVVPNPPLYEGLDDPSRVEMRFLTQRQCSLLATVTVQMTSDALVLSSDLLPGRTVYVSLTPPPDAKKYRSTLWSDVVVVQDMGDAAANFLQAVADCDANSDVKGVRLVHQAQEDERAANASYVPGSVSSSRGLLATFRPPVALSDGFPILLASEASLEELNRRLAAKNKAPIDISRFRPNLVVKGTKAFEEDYWKVIRIGDVVLHVVKGCPRCKQSCTDQTTGQVHDEPLATLSEFRALNPSNLADVFFGQNLLLDAGMEHKEIRVGDTLTVLQWTDRPVYEGD